MHYQVKRGKIQQAIQQQVNRTPKKALVREPGQSNGICGQTNKKEIGDSAPAKRQIGRMSRENPYRSPQSAAEIQEVGRLSLKKRRPDQVKHRFQMSHLGSENNTNISL